MFSNNVSPPKQIEFHEFLKSPSDTFNQLDQIDTNLREIFDTQLKIYKNLVSTNHMYSYPREVVEENTNVVEQFHINILRNRSKTILPRIIRKTLSNQNLEITNFSINGNLFSGVSSAIRSSLMESKINPEVLFSTDFSRQMLFLDKGLDKLSQHQAILRDVSQTHKIIYLLEGEMPIGIDLPMLFYVHVFDNESLEMSLSKLIDESKKFFTIRD